MTINGKFYQNLRDRSTPPGRQEAQGARNNYGDNYHNLIQAIRQKESTDCLNLLESCGIVSGFKCIGHTRDQLWGRFRLDNSQEWSDQQRQDWQRENQRRRNEQAREKLAELEGFPCPHCGNTQARIGAGRSGGES